jgi:hypothetical protein
MRQILRVSLMLATLMIVVCACSGAAFADNIAYFTQTNSPGNLPCSPATPCGYIDIALGTGSFSGQLVVTVQLSGPAQNFQFDRMGFNSDVMSGLFLDCFNFASTCTSGVGMATLGGSKQEDGFGRFDYTLNTGLNGGSGCNPDGMGCENLFTFVISDTNGPLSLSDFDTFVAGHVANGAGSGFIATGGSPVPEPTSLLLFGSGFLSMLGYIRRRM